MIPFDLRICFIHGFKQPPPNEAMSLKVFFLINCPTTHPSMGRLYTKINEIQLMCRVNSSALQVPWDGSWVPKLTCQDPPKQKKVPKRDREMSRPPAPWSLQEHPEVDSLRVGGKGVSEVSHEKKKGAPGCGCCLGYLLGTNKSSIQLFCGDYFSGKPMGNFRIPEN